MRQLVHAGVMTVAILSDVGLGAAYRWAITPQSVSRFVKIRPH
jgi:hypothetical protein